jgi:hypothetical protein
MSSGAPTRPADLSVVARQCIAAICLERFCARYGIRHPAINAFIEHLWSVASVTSEAFTEWEQGFQSLVASTWAGDLPTEVITAIPASARADYEQLADAAIE